MRHDFRIQPILWFFSSDFHFVSTKMIVHYCVYLMHCILFSYTRTRARTHTIMAMNLRICELKKKKKNLCYSLSGGCCLCRRRNSSTRKQQQQKLLKGNQLIMLLNHELYVERAHSNNQRKKIYRNDCVWFFFSLSKTKHCKNKITNMRCAQCQW